MRRFHETWRLLSVVLHWKYVCGVCTKEREREKEGEGLGGCQERKMWGVEKGTFSSLFSQGGN